MQQVSVCCCQSLSLTFTKTLVYDIICPFSIHYESVMLYNSRPRDQGANFIQLVSSIIKYHRPSLYLQDASTTSEQIATFCPVLWVLSGIARHRKGSGKRLNHLIPNGDFLTPHSFGIIMLVSSVLSDHIGKASAKKTDVLKIEPVACTIKIFW